MSFNAPAGKPRLRHRLALTAAGLMVTGGLSGLLALGSDGWIAAGYDASHKVSAVRALTPAAFVGDEADWLRQTPPSVYPVLNADPGPLRPGQRVQVDRVAGRSFEVLRVETLSADASETRERFALVTVRDWENGVAGAERRFVVAVPTLGLADKAL
jgi:hypothetical protein